jgi:hypothetical protein
VSYFEQMEGSIFSWKTSWLLFHAKVLSMKINYLAPFKHQHKHQKLGHENKLPRIPSLHGIGVMTFSMKISYWNTSWLLFHEMKECEVANFHGQASDAYAYVWLVQGNLFFMDNTLKSFKVLSMKIKYFAPFKHIHKHQKLGHEK